MSQPDPLAALERALADLSAAESAIDRLEAARRVRTHADRLETAEVRAAREHGVSWSKIGAVYGLTKQGAQQRFRGDERTKPRRDLS